MIIQNFILQYFAHDTSVVWLCYVHKYGNDMI